MNIEFIGEISNPLQVSILKQYDDFKLNYDPLDRDIFFFVDNYTGAVFCEVHIKAEKMLNNSTLDVPLDPENQSDYRANRDVVDDDDAYIKMQGDAENRRTFSNIVAEYNVTYDKKHPLKIIGGQHRYLAIQSAFSKGVNECHGVKMYFCLDKNQRLDVQLISNTNIAVSGDLLDRMYETVKGPELRDWCQRVGLLEKGEDFSDKKGRGSRITVRGARSFILSYFEGRKSDSKKYAKLNPEPILAKTGGVDEKWEEFRKNNPNFGLDNGLDKAGRELADLHRAQHDFITEKTGSMEFAEKVLSYSVLASWAYIAGVLFDNMERLEKHFSLKNRLGIDPLNTKALQQGKHKSDSDSYRGLATRTDLKDRGRMAELFFLQTEKGTGITPALVNAAITRYHAKLSELEAEAAYEKI